MKKLSPAEKRLREERRARYNGHLLNCRAVHCGSRGEYYVTNDWKKECDCDKRSRR